MSALLLDLDGTLLDRRRAFGAYAAWREEALGAGAAAELHACDALGWPAYGEAVARRWPEAFPTPETAWEDLWTHLPRLVAPFPGVVEALTALRGRVPLGIVTNGGPAQRRKLRATGLDALVDVVVVSAEEGLAKPDPALFRRALDRLGTEGGWMVGDDPAADVAGARAAGLSACWVSHGRAWPGGQPPDRVVAAPADGLVAP